MSVMNDDPDATSRRDRDSAGAAAGRSTACAANAHVQQSSRPLLGRAPGYPALEPVHEHRFHPELAGWRRNVGSAIALDLAPHASGPVTGLDVVSWNVAIGKADIGELLRRMLDGAWEDFGTRSDRPLVLLLQEAYREGADVPEHVHDALHGGRVVPGRSDIVEIAELMGFSLRYAPSMRNGLHRSDRGNAILSNVALEGTHAFLLPYVRQRRVALTTHLAGLPELVLASAHLDTGGSPPGAWRLRYGAGRLVQAAELAHQLVDPAHDASVILGADLNAPFGLRDPVVRALLDGGLHVARRVGKWRHTYHAGVRLPLDYVLHRSPAGRFSDVSVERIDEAPDDRSARVFGSDHHPLFARIDFAEAIMPDHLEQHSSTHLTDTQ